MLQANAEEPRPSPDGHVPHTYPRVSTHHPLGLLILALMEFPREDHRLLLYLPTRVLTAQAGASWDRMGQRDQRELL